MSNDLSQVVDALPVIVWTAGPEGSVDALNRRWRDYTGIPLDEARGEGWLRAVHPDDLAALRERWRSIVASGEPGEMETRLRRADGAYRWFLISSTPIRDAAGQVVEWCGVNTEIEDRRRAEALLAKVRSELTHVARVAAVGALAGSIAHEVNQPLSGIVTNASTCLRMLASAPPNVDGARETARRTIRDANRAADVIARLRALFAKKGAMSESLDLNEAARELIELSSPELQRNRVVVRPELGGDLPRVMGDRVQLQQVILNLLRNAVDAMSGVGDGPRELVIRTEREGDGQVRLTVKDNGVGFDAQGADKLFDAFYTTKSDGMGMGLSISRSIIESHHGRLWGASNDGPGATFAFSIPAPAHRARLPVDAARNAAPRVSEPSVGPA